METAELKIGHLGAMMPYWPLAGWSTHLEVRLALVAVEGVAQPPHLPEHPPPGPHPGLRLQYELT